MKKRKLNPVVVKWPAENWYSTKAKADEALKWYQERFPNATFRVKPYKTAAGTSAWAVARRQVK